MPCFGMKNKEKRNTRDDWVLRFLILGLCG